MTLAGPSLVINAAADTGKNPGRVAGVYFADDVVITGTVKQVEAEGSFWGIVGDDGKQYEVVNLPDEFKIQGLRLKVVGKVRPDQFSYHMWGIRVDAHVVEKIGE